MKYTLPDCDTLICVIFLHFNFSVRFIQIYNAKKVTYVI